MSRTEISEITVLCLISDGDKVLLQNRVKEDWKMRVYVIRYGKVLR